MAAITDTVKRSFNFEIFHKLDALLERNIVPAVDRIFAFPPNHLLSSKNWVQLLTTLCILVPIMMTVAFFAPYVVSMKRITKLKIRFFYIVIMPLLIYAPEVLFEGLRNPDVRAGTWFQQLDCDGVRSMSKRYEILRSILMNGAVWFSVEDWFLKRSERKQPAEGNDKTGEEEHTSKEKMKIFVIDDDVEKARRSSVP